MTATRHAVDLRSLPDGGSRTAVFRQTLQQTGLSSPSSADQRVPRRPSSLGR